MKIAFIDLALWDYSIESVEEMPLGGSQSALCYLAINFVQLGHDVFLLNGIEHPTISCGVRCLPINSVSTKFWSKFDFIIFLNCADCGKEFRALSGTQTQLILWSGHAENQPGVKGLLEDEERNAYDSFVLISEWQKSSYIKKFNLNPNKIVIFRNSIGEKFENLFDCHNSILDTKHNPLTLAYTSTPFRGLELLLDIFPKIRSHHPDVKLKIFSSMKVYQVSSSEDEAEYGPMYELFRQMEGVEYIGSIPQDELAKELKKVAVLAYPNTFPETSCIAVMEAMASGCYVISSELGALSETMAGFGSLISLENGIEAYKDQFVKITVDILNKLKSESKTELENQLREQVKFCNEEYTWRSRAHQWLQFLYKLKAYKYYNDGEYFIATEIYQETIEKYPEILENYYYLALCWILLEEDNEAFSVLWLVTETNLANESDKTTELLDDILNKEIKRFNDNQEFLCADRIKEFFLDLN